MKARGRKWLHVNIEAAKQLESCDFKIGMQFMSECRSFLYTHFKLDSQVPHGASLIRTCLPWYLNATGTCLTIAMWRTVTSRLWLMEAVTPRQHTPCFLFHEYFVFISIHVEVQSIYFRSRYSSCISWHWGQLKCIYLLLWWLAGINLVVLTSM